MKDSDIPDSDLQAMEEAQEYLANKKVDAITIGQRVKEIDPEMFNQIAEENKSKSVEQVGRVVMQADPDQAAALLNINSRGK